MSGTGEVLVMACRVQDFDPAAQQCLAPFWTYPPTLLPYLDATDGFQISGAIVGMWTLGLIARLIIRALQLEQSHIN